MLTLFLLILLFAVVEYFYFNSKIYSFRKKLLLLTRQIDNLKRKPTFTDNPAKKIHITYLPVPYKIGYAKENTYFYISPLEDSLTVYQCPVTMKIRIVDCAQIANSTWYNVCLLSPDFIMKGWMKESDIKFVLDETS